jgi:general secretion pathway protein D
VIVNAPRREHDQVAQLIEQIDKQTEQPQQSRVFKLQYAAATELAAVVQNVLITNTPRGRGGAGSQGVPIEQRFQQAFRFGSTQTAFGQVVADPRTNSLVVTDTVDNLALVEKVIKELDKEVVFENSSFVLSLENARADEVADLLNQSFGGRTGGGNLGRANRNTGTGAANRTRNTGGNTGPATQRGGPNAEDAITIDLEDPDADGGTLATRVTVGQGFGGGFGGGQQQPRNRAQQQGGNTTGLNAQGQVVNLRDLTGQVVAIPDINTNSVIIVTSPENRALLEQILEQLDRIPEQVMIETLIVEASLDATSKLGVEWSFTNPKIFGSSANGVGSQAFGVQANNAQPQGLRYTLTGNQYSVFLQALQSDARFDVLSTPRIFTSNNATAEINISQSLPYVTNQRVDANGNILVNYAFLDVGIILTVTPRITSNGYVTMDVTQTANDFVRYTEFNAPIVNQREAQTTVSVKDGETVVLGGVIRNSVSATVNKVPLLGDIPLLGNLFKSTETTKNKTELLVFLTPRVVRDANEARKVREQTEKQLQKKTQDRIKEVAPSAPPETEPGAPTGASGNPAPPQKP